MKPKTFDEKFKDKKAEIIKEFLEQHTVFQVEATGFFKDEEKARRIVEKLQKLGFTVALSRLV